MSVLIIAEAGVNHNGSMVIARKLVDAAVEAGVDIIKFQTFKAEKLVSKEAKKAEYQKSNIGDGNDSQFEMLKKLELSEQDHEELIAYWPSERHPFLVHGIQTLKAWITFIHLIWGCGRYRQVKSQTIRLSVR